MSDYVDNSDQTGFMDTSPFSMDLDQPTTKEYLDDFDWENPNYEDLAKVDWAALHDELMEWSAGELGDRPFMCDSYTTISDHQWSTEPVLSQNVSKSNLVSGKPRLNDDGVKSPATPMNAPVAEHSASSRVYCCDFEGCVKAYERKGDLNRHKRSHDSSMLLFKCSAIDCERASKGFTRQDKLTDHMCGGHDDDTMFTCTVCGTELTRDLFAVHAFHVSQRYRTCPLPKCPFKTKHLGYWDDLEILDSLRLHLLNKHDLPGRLRFAHLLEQKGYDARTCNVVCPICPSPCQFSCHEHFWFHFLQAHLGGPICAKHGDGSCEITCHSRGLRSRMMACTAISDEVLQHRRNILRVWPAFAWHKVWNDVGSYMCHVQLV